MGKAVNIAIPEPFGKPARNDSVLGKKLTHDTSAS